MTPEGFGPFGCETERIHLGAGVPAETLGLGAEVAPVAASAPIVEGEHLMTEVLKVETSGAAAVTWVREGELCVAVAEPELLVETWAAWMEGRSAQLSAVAGMVSVMSALTDTDTTSWVSFLGRSTGSDDGDGDGLGMSCPSSAAIAVTPCCSSLNRKTSSADIFLRSAIPVILF